MKMTDRELTGNGAVGSPAGLALLVGGLWFAAALALSLSGSLQTSQGVPPLKLLAAASVPIVVFVTWYRGFTAFRAWVLGLDLPLLVMLQAWRVVGGMFLVLLAFGLLPGLFAWPAGVGDVAIGVTAPAVALGLARRAKFGAGRGFVAWNLLGILDLVVAVAAGTLASGRVPGLVDGVTTNAMGGWPLSMIPGFFVPLFVILHLAAIAQARARSA